MKVCEQGYPSILRLHHYFLETRPMIAMELVDPIIACTAMACTTKEASTDMVHYIVINAPGHRDLIRAQIDDILNPATALYAALTPTCRTTPSPMLLATEISSRIRSQMHHRLHER